jgi:hypothetical protein
VGTEEGEERWNEIFTVWKYGSVDVVIDAWLLRSNADHGTLAYAVISQLDKPPHLLFNLKSSSPVHLPNKFHTPLKHLHPLFLQDETWHYNV